jgi:hypothetical protein
MKKYRCENCGSDPKRKRRGRFCSRCHYWHSRAKNLRDAILAMSESERSRGTPSALFKYRLRIALRVLEELRWRETGRIAPIVESSRIHSLGLTVAAACRSEVDESTLIELDRLSVRGRKSVHDMLLSIVSRLPLRRPALHLTGRAPRMLSFDGGWGDWASEYWTLSESERKANDDSCLRGLSWLTI